ncbi:TPA: hypothetical protein ACGTRQ_003765 [Vibrio parahaemolyticus]
MKNKLFYFSFIGCLSFSVYGEDYNGEMITHNLNNRYLSTPYACNDGASPYHCSGVIIRTLELVGYPWSYGSYDTERDAMSFSFLRSDIGPHPLYNNSVTGKTGIILKPLDSISSEQQPYDFYCYYPIDAITHLRDHHGCGEFVKSKQIKAIALVEDESTCEAKGITTADEWISTMFDDICSFSAQDPEQFKVSIEAQQKLPSDEFMWNELVMNLWDISLPHNLPIEALWVNVDGETGEIDEKGLATAQQGQIDMYNIANRYVPIVRFKEYYRPFPFVYIKDDQVITEPIQPQNINNTSNPELIG